jgi:dTMP kinase
MQGPLIVVEGLDGAGKSTQSLKLIEWLKETGHDHVVTFDFPAYDGSPFGKIIGRYLKGEFCDPVLHDPFESTLLFAGDRYHFCQELNEALKSGKCVVLNRYVSSNIAYSCAKLRLQSREQDVERFIAFNEQLEYGLLGLPRPDCTVFLDIAPTSADVLIRTRSGKDYLDGVERDRYEANRELQSYVRDAYHRYLKMDRSGTVVTIEANDGATLRSVDEIHADIKNFVSRALDQRKRIPTD